MSANDIVGNADSSNSNTIKMDIKDIPNTRCLFRVIQKTDTIKFMDRTFKRVSMTTIYKHWPMRIARPSSSF